MSMPTLYIPHGAGPCFFMDWRPADTWSRMRHWLEGLESHVGMRPRALLVISAHWETIIPTVNAAPRHTLLFDYYGFPESTYRLTWPAPGSPELGARVRQLLTAAGVPCREETRRGLDHGVFIPLKLAFPAADIPVVQLSLREDMDPAAHMALGRALGPLREEGVLLIGSGMSYHNMQRFRFEGGPADPDSVRFDTWLEETLGLTGAGREARLGAWADAPAARAAHPREEHLLPLHVVAGAATDEPGVPVFRDTVMASAQSAYRFGAPAEPGAG